FRRVIIPRRHAVLRRILQVVTGVEHRRLQILRPPGLQIRAREAVKRPGKAAAPTRVAAIALMSRLAQALASLEVEYRFVRRGAVAPHQRAASRQTMSVRDVEQPLVARLESSVKDHADIHHDVYEERRGFDERAQILALLHKTHGHSLAGLNQQGLDAPLRAAQTEPAQMSRKEEKAEVVNGPVVLPFFERRGVGDGLVEPG